MNILLLNLATSGGITTTQQWNNGFQRCGHKVYALFSPVPGYPQEKFSKNDLFDRFDESFLESFVTKHSIDIIVPLADYCIPVMSKLNEIFELPGLNQYQSRILLDKAAWNKQFENSDIVKTIPTFYLDEILEFGELPPEYDIYVIKPSNGSACYNMFTVYDKADIANLLEQGKAWKGSRPDFGRLIVQPFLKGDRIVLPCSISQDELHIHMVIKNIDQPLPYFGKIGAWVSKYPSPETANDTLVSACKIIIKEVSENLNLPKVQSNAEFIVNDEGIFLHDFNPRASGWLWNHIRDSMGMDYCYNSAKWFIDGDENFSSWNGLVAYQHQGILSPGKISNVVFPKDHMVKPIGDWTSTPVPEIFNRNIHPHILYALGETLQEAKERLEDYRSKIYAS